MNVDMPLERRIADFLTSEVTSRAPDRILEAALERVAVLPQRRSVADRFGRSWSVLTVRRRALLVILGLVVLGGAAAAGAYLLRSDDLGQGPPELVLVRHRAVDAGPEIPVSVIAIDAEGRERELGSVTGDQLGSATYTEWYAGLSADGDLVLPVSLPGGASGPVVVDLRSPGAVALQPDAQGAFPAVAADGRLAFSRNDGRYAIFDPATNATEALIVPGDVAVIQLGFGPVWEAGERGLAAARSGKLGYLGLDGTFVASDGRAYYGGVGPRRTDAAGRWLRCISGDDATCDQPDTDLLADGGPTGAVAVPIWSEQIPGAIMADWSWAADGSVWALMETDAPGPRTVTILKVAPDGTTTTVASFDGVADDPDPSSYFPAGTFAGFAPNDERVLVSMRGDGDAPAEMWSIDPTTNATTRLPDGIVAGWLSPAALSAARPSTVPFVATDPAIRGDWNDGRTSLQIGQTTFSMVESSASAAGGRLLHVSATATGEIDVSGASLQPDCSLDQRGDYRWTATAESLTLTVLADACAERAALLGSTFRRVLPYPDTGGVPVAAGSRFVVPDAVLPFALSVPSTMTPVVVDGHSPGVIAISSGADDGAIRVSIVLPDRGAAEPCTRSEASVPLAQGVAGIGAFLDGQAAPVTVTPAESVRVAGIAARTVVVEADDSCRGLSLFTVAGEPRPVYSGPGRYSILEPVPGHTVVVIVSDAIDPTPETVAWADELLDSLRFEGAPVP